MNADEKDMLILKKATEDDMKTIWKMQVRAFSDLLEKYQDFETSPAAEGFEKVLARYRQPWTTYYSSPIAASGSVTCSVREAETPFHKVAVIVTSPVPVSSINSVSATATSGSEDDHLIVPVMASSGTTLYWIQ